MVSDKAVGLADSGLTLRAWRKRAEEAEHRAMELEKAYREWVDLALDLELQVRELEAKLPREAF